MTYFFDNNISRMIVRSLRAEGVDAIHIQDEFRENTDDVDWISLVGIKGYTVVSADVAIRRNPAERHALEKANVPAIFLFTGYTNLSREGQETWMKAHWPAIDAAGQTLTPGAILFVTKEGDILTPEEKKERAQQPQLKKRPVNKGRSE